MKDTKTVNHRVNVRWGLLGVLVLGLIAVGFVFPAPVNRVFRSLENIGLGIPQIPETPFRLGLDLQGGAHLVYEADTTDVINQDQGEAVEGVRDVIERRVNSLGVGEPNVQITQDGNTYRILVELPGVTDINQAIAMIGETPILEFKEVNEEPPRELTAEEEKAIQDYNSKAKVRVDEALKKVKSGQDFAAIAKEYSEDEASKNNGGYLNFVTRETIAPQIYEWASKSKTGTISPTAIQSPEGYNILKRGEEKEGELEVEARHILICYFGAEGCSLTLTKEEAKIKAGELFKEATAENFTDLAREHSTDKATKDKGGDLGSFRRGQMVPEFEKAVFDAKVDEIIGPVETSSGYHIIYKVGEATAKEYELSRILVRTQSAADILPPPDAWKNTGLSGKQLDRAEVVTDPTTGAVQVSLQFDDEGSALFQELTRKNINKPIAIFLDGEPISVPTVNQEIVGGQAVITGAFNIQEAKTLAQRLNTGALPVPVELVSQQNVGASLGAESLALSLRAGIISLLLVMLFMILYYRLPGLVAVIALSLYTVLTLAIFKLIHVTLSLSGIAGFILSIGMAVDANVLIFERLKEELRAGKSLKAATEEGFLRAWSSIRDSNISTLITSLILLSFGSSFVKGFAVTLILGILVSMFTAITVTRILLRYLVPWFKEQGNKLFLGARNSSSE